MTNNEQVLLESQTARNTQLAQIEDKSEELLNKAKLLHFNVWQGVGAATTEQVAEFYEVPITTVKSVVKYHRSEFDADGLKTFKSGELKELRLKFNLTPNTPQITIWNPCSTLRLGYLLRDSTVAKAVRTTSLDFIEQAASPKTHAEITLAHSQRLVDDEKWKAQKEKWEAEANQRFTSLESDMQKMKQIRIDATNELNKATLPPAKTETPILETRRALLHVVNLYCRKEVVEPQNAWNLLYEQLRLRCGFAVKKRNHLKNETYLDVVVRHGYLDKIYAIALDYFGLQGSKAASSGD